MTTRSEAPLNHDDVKRFVAERLQPLVRVDGGNIEFERVDAEGIHLGAHAECSVCPAMPRCLRAWVEAECRDAFGVPCRVVLHARPPYYKR